jgi:hypothetical protein
LLPEEEEKHFAVWPENWDTVELFLRCQTQWRTSIGGVTGFDYSSVLALVNMYAYSKETFEDLQIMESKAIELLNKEKK